MMQDLHSSVIPIHNVDSRPTPDELVDLLRQLENLACSDPNKYQFIIGQINGNIEIPKIDGKTSSKDSNEKKIDNVINSSSTTKKNVSSPSSNYKKSKITNNNNVTRQSMQAARKSLTTDLTVIKHDDTTESRESFYPKPLENYEYPWSGSLRPVSNEFGRRINLPKRIHPDHEDDNEENDNPWSGTLKHIGVVNNSGAHDRKEILDDNVVPWKGSLKHISSKGIHKSDKMGGVVVAGSAASPWKGTLRHVKPDEIRQFKNVPRWQCKRYPEEDAPNPYKDIQGRDARPVLPVLTCNIKNDKPNNDRGNENSFDEEAQVEKIRECLRRRRKQMDCSTMKNIMPKLLKEYDSKSDAMDVMEMQNIMDELNNRKSFVNVLNDPDVISEADEIINRILNDTRT